MQQTISRVWFLNQGCKQCPIEITIKPLWANGDEGYFLSERGNKLKPHQGPANRKGGSNAYNKKRGVVHPQLRYGCLYAHRLMAATYADEPCPIFLDSKGKPYKGIVHHVIENSLDFRVDNLIWWLNRKQHAIADKRRRVLEGILPDMYAIPTKRLKRLQDPRITSDELFDRYIQLLKNVF